MTAVRFQSGAPAVRAAVERFFAEGASDADARGAGAAARGSAAGAAAAEVIAESARRRIVRLRDAEAGELAVKQFRTASGRHPWRDAAKAALGRGQARREARALGALRAAGVPVPEPLARGTLEGGDALLVLRFVAGAPLADALAEAAPAERRALLSRLGAAVAALHRAGYVHGDLQRGNVLVAQGHVVLLDLQHARRTRARPARLADLGRLDHSLWGRASAAERVRLRAAALGLSRPFDAAARAELRDAGRAAEARARDHARGRTRRALRPGRRFARARAGRLVGLRLRELSEAELRRALAEHEAAKRAADARVLKADGRSRLTALAVGGRRAVMKETPWRGLPRALADLARGSAARRAWRAGHGLLARGIGAATPLAFLEERRLGVPVRSLVVLEDLRPAPDGLEASRLDPEAALAALADLAVRLHRCGVDHGDLKCTNAHLVFGPPPEARLVDLEGVRIRRRVGEAARIEALAQLNASLPDEVPAAARRRAFARYCAALPFGRGREAALAAVVARSLARRHRWTGSGCALAAPARAVPRGGPEGAG